MNMLFKIISILSILFICAFSPEEHLPEQQEKIARELFLQIKCPVCAGQVIESSDAPVSYELRKLVREKIKEGKDSNQIKAELVQIYGEEILVSEEINKQNFLIWILPILFLLAGIVFLRKAKIS